MKLNENLMKRQSKAKRTFADALCELQTVTEEVKREENKILHNMFAKVEASENGMTAKQVAAAMGGVMSWQQACANLSIAANSYGHGDMTYSNHKYDETKRQLATGNIVKVHKTTTRTFAEVDATGQLVPNGQTVTQTRTERLYHSRGL